MAVDRHKVFIVGVFTLPALLVFAINGHVWWIGGASLAVGNASGAWLASIRRSSRSRPRRCASC